MDTPEPLSVVARSQIIVDVVEALNTYEDAVSVEDQTKAAESVMDVVMGHFMKDGIDSIWYGRSLDRLNQEAYYASMRMADDCTFYGLVRLLHNWAEATNPPTVRTANDW